MSKSSSKNEWKQTHSMFPKNWHFNSRFVLKTTKTPMSVFITEIFWQTVWRNNWRFVFDVVKRLFFRVWCLKKISLKTNFIYNLDCPVGFLLKSAPSRRGSYGCQSFQAFETKTNDANVTQCALVGLDFSPKDNY